MSNTLMEYDYVEPDVPDFSCHHIDDVIDKLEFVRISRYAEDFVHDKLEKIREINNQLRNNHDEWKEIAKNLRELAMELDERVKELEAQYEPE